MAEMDRSTAVEVGYRLSGGLLIEQANATKNIALADLAALKAEGLLGDQDIAGVDLLIGEVHEGLEDQAGAASEARAQTVGQANALLSVVAMSDGGVRKLCDGSGPGLGV